MIFCIALWVSRALKYPKKCLQDLTMFFMSTWWGDSKNMKEIESSRWLFELPAKWHSQFSPSGSTFLPCFSLPSKSHRENSIPSIVLESLHQVDMKNVVKSSKHFFGYFNTLETHSVMNCTSYFNVQIYCQIVFLFVLIPAKIFLRFTSPDYFFFMVQYNFSVNAVAWDAFKLSA